jgi:hypothetical protein
MNVDVTDPGHESLPADYTTMIPAHFDGTGCQVFPATARRGPLQVWYDYRADLLTRSALADMLSPLQRLRLTGELIGITLVAGVVVTAVVLAGLVAVAGLIGLLA